MKFRMLLFALAVGVLSASGAMAASCTAYTSTSSLSGYTRAATVGDTTNCSSYTTQYYIDANTKTYHMVYSCSACTGSSVYKVDQTGGIGDCTYSYSWCSACTYTTTKPNSVSALGGPTAPSSCSTQSTQYVISSAVAGYMSITSCATCPSGYWKKYYYGKLNGCPYQYVQCTRCTPGTYKVSQSCISCSAGTYSDTYNASSCSTCPSASDIYTTSALSTLASVSSGKITSDAGIGASSYCYIKPGTYYNSTGTFTYGGTCTYTNVATVDKCATVTTACISSNMELSAGVVQNGDLATKAASYGSGAGCFCGANNRYYFFATMGQYVTSSSSLCESSCPSACAGSVNGKRSELGCD